MAEQDDATTLGNIQLAIQQAMMDARTVTVGKVTTYKEIGPNRAPVVDVQVAPKRLARPVNGGRSEAADVPVLPNVHEKIHRGQLSADCGRILKRTKRISHEIR